MNVLQTAISAAPSPGHHVAMATTQPVRSPKAAPPRLELLAGGRRDAALRRAQEARRRLQPRHERFAHLKRSYD